MSASKVTVVAGASRTAGRGVALGWGAVGHAADLSRRAVRSGRANRWPGSVNNAASLKARCANGFCRRGMLADARPTSFAAAA